MANRLYNGVPLPDIDSVWTDKSSYPHAYLANRGSLYLLFLTAKAHIVAADGSTVFTTDMHNYKLSSEGWVETTDAGLAAAIFWSNTDVYYGDTIGGTLYLAASDPVPVTTINPSALMQGFFVGDAIKRMRGVQPEQPEPEQPSGKLVGYLYGGVGPLPEIPKVEGLDYSWVIDGTAMQMGYMAITANIAPSFDSGIVGAFGCKYVAYTTDGTAWNVAEEGDKTGTDGGVGQHISLAPPVWTSHDILTADGSTYLAASEPVPVYE